MNIRNEPGLSYDDVLLVPKRGILVNRKDATLVTRFVEGRMIAIPIVSAPMASVTEGEMARAMSNAGGLGVIHRGTQGQPMSIQAQAVQFLFPNARAAIAIGVHDGIERASYLTRLGAREFVLDVAHAHSDTVYDFVTEFRLAYQPEVKLIVGNIATAEAAEELEQAGADGFKVGIGPGAACTTREVTGFGVPQLTAIMDVRSVTDLPIIADGGIKNSGDIVKALAAGADTVMIGRLLAGADEAPFPGEYYGMASKRVNGHNAPEGIEGKVERTGPAGDTIKRLAWGIRSGMSYAGARNLEELQQNAEFIKVSPLAQQESGTRI